MKITDTQQAALSIQLSALGQVDLSDNDDDTLWTLRHLLKEAYDNVCRAQETKKHRRASGEQA